MCLSTQKRSDKDIATLFELFIALSNAFFGSPSSHKYPSSMVISAFFKSFSLISLSLIFPAVPKKVHIVLSESGVISIKQLPVGIGSSFLSYKKFTFSFLRPSSYFWPNSSFLIFPINPTSLPSWDKPTIEFATEPPDTVSSILTSLSKFLNSFSLINFIVLFVREFFDKNASSTRHRTSTIAFPIPKIFILCF